MQEEWQEARQLVGLEATWERWQEDPGPKHVDQGFPGKPSPFL